ncbi:MAG: glycine cleavage system protein GcvH [Pseudomonadota bacterium]
MDIPSDRLYSEYHIWVKFDDGTATVGISDYAREEFGGADYVELPEPESSITRDSPFGVVETSKAVTDLIAPISGVVIESNTALLESPEVLTSDPYGDGWLVVVDPADPDEKAGLMTAQAYKKLLESQGE